MVEIENNFEIAGKNPNEKTNRHTTFNIDFRPVDRARQQLTKKSTPQQNKTSTKTKTTDNEHICWSKK